MFCGVDRNFVGENFISNWYKNVLKKFHQQKNCTFYSLMKKVQNGCEKPGIHLKIP